MIDEDAIRYRWDSVGSKLDERGRRLFAAGEVRTAGWGGLVVVSRITGLAQGTKSRIKTLQTGKWTVERSVDSMTDEVVCTGFHASSAGIQVSEKAMYIKVRGGIQSVTFRFGEIPARAMRLAKDIEKKRRCSRSMLMPVTIVEIVGLNRRDRAAVLILARLAAQTGLPP